MPALAPFDQPAESRDQPRRSLHSGAWNLRVLPAAAMTASLFAADAIRAEHPHLRRVLGGISPIDPDFIRNMPQQYVLGHVDLVAVQGFPLDWNRWTIHEWPGKLDEIRAVTDLPVWISEVGVATFGAEEVQEFGLRRSAELLIGRAQRIHWYSLYDLPRAWPATTRHREAEGSSYYAISIWACCATTARPNAPSRCSPITRPISVSASGSTAKTTASTTPFAASRTSASATCAPG
jgi:beta-xylosidase